MKLYFYITRYSYPEMIVHNFVDIFLNLFHWPYCEEHNLKNSNFISLESMKNIACDHCNLNKINHKEVFFWPTQNGDLKKMTFKMDNNFGMEGALGKIWILQCAAKE